MIDLTPGDIVSCRIRSSEIVDCFAKFDEIMSFVIICKDDDGFYLYIPHHILLKNCSIADAHKCRRLGIEQRYLNEQIAYISENMIAAVASKQDGRACKQCRDFYPYAVANQPDGTLVCFSCRQNCYR
jgi:hypothetical protein